MEANSTTEKRKRGPQPLSPNGLDGEMRREAKRKHAKRRKPKSSRGRTEMRKRQEDKLRRARRKALRRRRLREPLGATVRRRRKAVRYYQHWCAHTTEQAAAQRSAAKYGVSASTIRLWTRTYRQAGLEGLLPKLPGPKDPAARVSLAVQFLIVALRQLLGWNEKRMAEELAQRGLAKVSHTTVGRIFARYHLPTRTYHSQARRDGVPKHRYEKPRPNQQWHIDFTETRLVDGTSVVIVVLTDDHSRYCLHCDVTPDMTAETAIDVVQQAWQSFGLPDEIVSDNGRAFTSIYEGVDTAFGQTLQRHGVRHCLITPYYPEGNGKAEAFIKILKRECLNRAFASVAELRQALAAFVTYYNHFRLHSSLGYQPPVARYLGIQPLRDHGLAGIPNLPAELVNAFPPAQPVTLPTVDAWSIKRQFALVPVDC